MTRRTLFALPLASAAFAATRSSMGVATTCFMSYRRPKDTLEFLEYAHGLGAAGIQASLASLEPAYVDRVSRRAKELGMYLEVMSPMPTVDMARFVDIVAAAKRAGAICVRAACLGGRRYETFKTAGDWQKFVQDSRSAIARAVPVVEQQRIPLAIENHKDWTVEEFVKILKSHESQYLGVCLDTGNNIALLDDPYEVVERLAPYAVSTHIKDMGVDEAPDGFLLSELPLGTGILDIPRIVKTIRQARPDTRLTLEMITRDPLRVPALTDAYWTTFSERNGLHLARTMRLVRERRKPLPTFSTLPRTEQLRLEEDNVRRCLSFAL